jgi:ABC-type lipoprotein release transport system permease subunit
MYKAILCWRYLRTRWIALASIISVTLGVATMIVVNSVMEGFRHEMQERIHGILSDVVFESNTLVGFYDPGWHMEQIRRVAGEYIEGMTATVVVPAMLSYQHNDVWITRPVQLIGIDERTQSQVGDFCKYLQHPANRERISFELREDGYDVHDHQSGADAPPRVDMSEAGWTHRRKWVERKRLLDSMEPRADRAADGPAHRVAPPEMLEAPNELMPTESATLEPISPHEWFAVNLAAFAAEPGAEDASPDARASVADESTLADEPGRGQGADDESNPLRGALPGLSGSGVPADVPEVAEAPPEAAAPSEPLAIAAEPAPLTVPPPGDEAAAAPLNPFAQYPTTGDSFDPGTTQNPGAVVGIALVNYRDAAGHDRFLGLPGDDVQISFPKAGTPPEVGHATFTIVDLYESKMSEYDSSFVFVPIETLQQYRGMFDPETRIGYATSIQIKLKPGANGQIVRDMLRGAFVPQLYSVSTWRDKQGPLLAAVQMETAILNVLLFMIITVAGFGILAIFFMIVVEKTRDIGVLKSLGASRRGIMGIFLGYGLSLGCVGAGAGLVIGLAFVAYINEIADLLGMITGHEVFDPSIYYFQQIPTIVEPTTVAWVVLGALVIAVLASVLPARRAARLHPVEALRYE